MPTLSPPHPRRLACASASACCAPGASSQPAMSRRAHASPARRWSASLALMKASRTSCSSSSVPCRGVGWPAVSPWRICLRACVLLELELAGWLLFSLGWWATGPARARPAEHWPAGSRPSMRGICRVERAKLAAVQCPARRPHNAGEQRVAELACGGGGAGSRLRRRRPSRCCRRRGMSTCPQAEAGPPPSSSVPPSAPSGSPTGGGACASA